MATLACPECAARVDVPDGTRKNAPVTCPACNEVFLTPELPKPKPKPTTVVGGRSDYLDAEDFTPDQKPKKPRRPALVLSGPVTVCFIVGSVLVASLAGGVLVYTTLKAQGRIPADSSPGGGPLGPPAPAPAPAPPPAPVPAAVGGNPAAAPAPPGFAPPATANEAWRLLVGTWKLADKPAVEPDDEPSVLTKLRFDPDRTAVLTDNLWEHTKGKTPNFDDLNTVTKVVVANAGVTLHLRPKADGDDQTLALTFDARDRLTVDFRPREEGPAYKFRFAKAP